MQYKLSWHYHFGRIVLALCIVFFGYNISQASSEFYKPFLHAWRRMMLPESKNRISEELTYEVIFETILQVVGGTMMLGGMLIALNRRVIGGLLVLLSFGFILATQDNPMLIEYIKPKPRSPTIKYEDLARHISLMGAILYMMVVPEDPETYGGGEHGDTKVKEE